MARIRRGGRLVYVGEPYKFDPSPLFACEVRKDGSVDNAMAFDPRYGPESQEQIDYFTQRGDDTRSWEVGKPL